MPRQPAGAAMYILNLSHALARTDVGHDYVLYVRHHSLAAFRDLPPSFAVVDIGERSRWRRQVWEQVSLPLDLRKRLVA